MEDEITETQTATVEKPLSTREEMLNSIDEDSATESSSGNDEDSNETETEIDSESKDDESKDDDKEDDKSSKKQNRYQRLKAKAEAAQNLVKVATSERDEAIKYANIYRKRFQALEKRFTSIISDKNVEINPVDEENFSLKLRNEEQKLADEIDNYHQQERIKQEIQEQKQELSRDFATEALNLVSKVTKNKEEYRPLAKKVLTAHAIALRSNPEQTMQETAKLIFAMMKKTSSDNEQHEANKSVPRPLVRGASRQGARPVFKSMREEALAFLENDLNGE